MSSWIASYQGAVKLQLTQVPLCLWRLCKMTHISPGNSVAGECHFGFPSRYVEVLFAYLLKSFGFKTFKFGGSQLQNNIYSFKTGHLPPCLFCFIYIFFLGDAGLIRLNGIDFEISSSQVNPTKKELISCPGSNYASRVFCIDWC